MSPGSFFQSGPAAAEVLIKALTNAIAGDLPADGLLVDAYAGIGLLGGSLTGEGHHLVVIESHPNAVKDAKHNLADHNTRIYQGDVGDWEPRPDERADVVIADPARPGLGRPVNSRTTR